MCSENSESEQQFTGHTLLLNVSYNSFVIANNDKQRWLPVQTHISPSYPRSCRRPCVAWGSSASWSRRLSYCITTLYPGDLKHILLYPKAP